MRPEAERWLAKAIEDFDDARDMFQRERFSPAGFFAQQAAEKSLKAVLLQRQGQFRRIHDVVALAREAKAPPALVEACEVLRPAYVAYRYPDVEEPAAASDVADQVQVAGEVVSWARQQLL